MENGKVDESFLMDFEILQILQGGDFSPIDQYLEQIAYKNLDYKLMAHKQAPLIGKLLKIQQLGSQLLNFKMRSNGQKAQLLHSYIQYERQQELKLKALREH